MEGTPTPTLDLFAEYCAKSDELAILILSLQDGPYTSYAREQVQRKRDEVEALLDRMIGG